MKKKIAFFLPSLVGGGAERVMLNLAIEFANEGHEVDLVLVQAKGAYIPQVPSNINLVDLQSSRTLLSLKPLISYLRESKPDTLLSALNHANIIAIWAVALAKVKTKTMVSIHSNVSQFSKVNSRSFIVKIFPALMKRTFRRADRIIAVSEGVASDLCFVLNYPREKIDVIYNPVVDDQLIARSKEHIEHPWFEPDQPPTILSVGRLTTEKDFPTLIKAFAEIRKTKIARLMILGEGEKRNELENLIRQLRLEKDVYMPGFVENPYSYMRQANVFVLSSRYEGLPTVLIEALACGTEVISTDCPSGPREILKDGYYGTLVKVQDVTGLSKAIEHKLNSMNKQNVDVVFKPFKKSEVLAQYLEMI